MLLPAALGWLPCIWHSVPVPKSLPRPAAPRSAPDLQGLGIQHTMDSRSLDFADEIMARTQGEGVDLVLNSLAGEAIPRSLATLRANGVFKSASVRSTTVAGSTWACSKKTSGFLRLT